eukprot:6204354-Pleurochrysis_carterae.AAC.6
MLASRRHARLTNCCLAPPAFRNTHTLRCRMNRKGRESKWACSLMHFGFGNLGNEDIAKRVEIDTTCPA